MQELKKNIITFLNSANVVYETKDYTSATILYFKAFFVALDLFLLQKEGKTPKDHSERFRMLEDSHTDLYIILDKYFSVYRDTYSLTIEKQRCDEVKKHVEDIIKRYNLQ